MAVGLVSLVAEDLGDFRLARVNVGERIRAGLARARRNGTRSGRPLGRPRVSVDAAEIVRRRQRGESWREIASGMRLGLGTVLRAYPTPRNAPSAFQKLLAGPSGRGSNPSVLASAP